MKKPVAALRAIWSRGIPTKDYQLALDIASRVGEVGVKEKHSLRAGRKASSRSNTVARVVLPYSIRPSEQYLELGKTILSKEDLTVPQLAKKMKCSNVHARRVVHALGAKDTGETGSRGKAKVWTLK